MTLFLFKSLHYECVNHVTESINRVTHSYYKQRTFVT